MGTWRAVLWAHGGQCCGHLEVSDVGNWGLILWAHGGQCQDMPGDSVKESSSHAPCWVDLACR